MKKLANPLTPAEADKIKILCDPVRARAMWDALDNAEYARLMCRQRRVRRRK